MRLRYFRFVSDQASIFYGEFYSAICTRFEMSTDLLFLVAIYGIDPREQWPVAAAAQKAIVVTERLDLSFVIR